MVPEKTIRDGALSVSVWKNDGKERPYYSCQFQKVYSDENGDAMNTQSFNTSDLLRLARLAQKAYDYICSNKAEPAR